MRTEFCKGCGRKLMMIPIIGERTVEFEDGVYCEKCAKFKIEESRKKFKR